jgi:tRNA nucleotidyltransferase (CCA-adding enzyme)
MVGNHPEMTRHLRPTDEMLAALEGAVPELPALLDAAAGSRLYLVGGTVRDMLTGRGRTDLDIAVEGDPAKVAARLGGEVVAHERFSTAKVRLGAAHIDLARTRAETYPEPGALPEVRPAGIEEDLERRDFTINAMALPLSGERELLDPHGGRWDLSEGLLRVLHDRSFADDPTRALRAARYAARFGLELELETEDRLRAADLSTVSEDRRRAELLRIAAEPAATAAFGLLADWGLLEVSGEALRTCERVAELMAAPPWSAVAERDRALLAALDGPTPKAGELLEARPTRPSEGVETARGATPEDLVIARALGAKWLDDYIASWRSVVLEVGGEDLIAAGVPEGPAIGRGLAAALRAKLDGELSGRDAELEAALRAAREGS